VDHGAPGPGPGTENACSGDAPDVECDVVLSGNLPGCNTVEEIRTATGPARFAVSKDFDDGNPGPVLVTLSCNTGLPLEQTKTISEGDGVTFVINDFENEALDCQVFESPVDGYTVSYVSGGDSANEAGPGGCAFTAIGGGDENSCAVTNTLGQVRVDVRKIWFDDHPEFNNPMYARGRWNCYSSQYYRDADNPEHYGCDGDVCGSLSFYGPDDTDSFYVYPDYDGSTWCSVEEKVFESGVESNASNCAVLFVSPGQGNACTITNTRFYQGIPTLSQYGLAILALLMLGVGLVGFRRFV
jgi:hypothetical protein